MPIRVCALFRPLNSKEKLSHGDSISIRRIDSESFIFKDEKEDDFDFQFDKVFYQGSEQADIYEFLGSPTVRDVINGVNGAIITYGQTGAGKTYSMEGLSVRHSDEKQKGLLPRVVDGIFNTLKESDETAKFTIKLSMVEIYMERVRDLLDPLKDNLQIKESKGQGIFVSGVTEVSIPDSDEALQSLSRGIANKAVGETRILHLSNLAGSEKAEKTGAAGRVLEEAKTINKSLSALGNVINALTYVSPMAARANHIPYRDSKLTRILQDALGGDSRTALLCCCSPSPSNASESISTLRFGGRAKHIKALPRASLKDDDSSSTPRALSSDINESRERILEKLGQSLKAEDVQLLEQLFIIEGIFFDPNSVEEVEAAYEDITSRTISSLQKKVEELVTTNQKLITTNEKLEKENQAMKRPYWKILSFF